MHEEAQIPSDQEGQPPTCANMAFNKNTSRWQEVSWVSLGLGH